MTIIVDPVVYYRDARKHDPRKDFVRRYGV